jgi:hypothetical protein
MPKGSEKRPYLLGFPDSLSKLPNKVLCLGQHLRTGSGLNHLVRLGTEAGNLLIKLNFFLSVIQLGNQTPRGDEDGGGDVRCRGGAEERAMYLHLEEVCSRLTKSRVRP